MGNQFGIVLIIPLPIAFQVPLCDKIIIIIIIIIIITIMSLFSEDNIFSIQY